MTYPSTSSDWLKRLIGFDTLSHKSNLALIDDVRAFLLTLGLSPVVLANKTGDKANLLVSVYNDNDSHRRGGIVLSGHSDVVPTANQAWSQNPFCAWERDGKIYGRGACDMKGFVACCLNFLPQAVAKAKQNKLNHPLHLAISFDEEIGCLGVPLLLDYFKKSLIAPTYCIVGEPTQMQAVVAHKGICVYECCVYGRAVHSSLAPTGVNAIGYAAKMIEFIGELAKQLTKKAQDTAFDVPFSTLSVGQIQGGTAVNIVADSCSFVFEQRHLPNTNPDGVIDKICAYAGQLTKQMQAVAPECGIEIKQQVSVPALACDDKQIRLLALIEQAKANNKNIKADHQISTLAQALSFDTISANDTVPTNDTVSAKTVSVKTISAKTSAIAHKTAQKVAYATEGGHFYQAGITTVICGPGSISQAHKADEFIEIDELCRCDDFLQGLFWD